MTRTKVCSGCHKARPIKQFRFHRKKTGVRHVRCNRCHADRQTMKRRKNPESVRVRNLLQSSGLTMKTYGLLFELQKGLCAICRLPERSRWKKYLSVDHDHETDQFRGLLCSSCNSGMGFFRDDIRTLESAVLYLKRFR